MSVLMMDMEPGDAISINGPAKITIEDKTGRRARIRIEADKSVQVIRLTGGHIAHTNPKLKRADKEEAQWQER